MLPLIELAIINFTIPIYHTSLYGFETNTRKKKNLHFLDVSTSPKNDCHSDLEWYYKEEKKIRKVKDIRVISSICNFFFNKDIITKDQ